MYDILDKSINTTMLKQIIAVTFFASCGVCADTQHARACADVGHLDGYSKGSTLDEIIGGMNTACPSTITLNAGMTGFAICEKSRFSRYGKTIFLIGNGQQVTAIRRGPKSYGNYCAWK
jgi:hypothetical protein